MPKFRKEEKVFFLTEIMFVFIYTHGHSEFDSITEKTLGQWRSFCISSQWFSKIYLVVQWLLCAATVGNRLYKEAELTIYDWHRKISYTLLYIFLVDCTAFWSRKLFLLRMFPWCFMSLSEQSGCIKALLCSGGEFTQQAFLVCYAGTEILGDKMETTFSSQSINFRWNGCLIMVSKKITCVMLRCKHPPLELGSERTCWIWGNILKLNCSQWKLNNIFVTLDSPLLYVYAG